MRPNNVQWLFNYYSPTAYDFVSKIFALSHASGIRTRAASVECEPVYLINVMKQIGNIVKMKWMSDAVLIVNKMDLH